MIVVADTCPLNYLILIGHIDILQALYNEVVIPPAVQDEMLHPSAPQAVRSWISVPLSWLEVRTPSRSDPQVNPFLDDGELEAITLIRNLGPRSILLIDELRGREEAKRLGIEIIGTLGVLLLAHQRKLLQLSTAIELLKQTTFKGTESLFQFFLDQA